MKTPAVLVVAVLALAPAARAAPAETVLIVHPGTGGAADGAPYRARYSDAVALEVKLTAQDGTPLKDERVELRVADSASPGDRVLLGEFTTDTAGIATACLPLVDGSFGGRSWPGSDAAPEGRRYVVTARFGGAAPEPGACADADGGVSPDAGDPLDPATALACSGLAESNGEGAVLVTLEQPELVLGAGAEAALGETLQLRATLTDADGLATACDGVTDRDPVPIAGATVLFFYDVDNNGLPRASEQLSSAVTDEEGVARIEAVLDPRFFRAGDFPTGVFAQCGTDGERYAIAGASGRLVILAGAPDAARTVLEVDPASLPADGFGRAELRARLVDQNNNLLDVESPPADVSFTTTFATLEGAVERDPLTGHYVQSLLAPRNGGVAVVTVIVNGISGPAKEVVFEGPAGCGCAAARQSAPASILLVAILILPLYVRRRR